MATILPFKVRARTQSRNPAPPGTAAIVIFPGVRYERRQETAAAGPQARRPAPQAHAPGK